MKTFLILCLLSFVGLSLAETSLYPRGCVYIEGKCERECEEGTYLYTLGCGYFDPEPTCDDPIPETDPTGMTCDFSDCYCEPPTVRDEKTKKCVSLDECPKKTISN